MMVYAGASEQAVSQWVSPFAEKGLGISKVAGDLAGQMAFAVLVGISRQIFHMWEGAEKLHTEYMLAARQMVHTRQHFQICRLQNTSGNQMRIGVTNGIY